MKDLKAVNRMTAPDYLVERLGSFFRTVKVDIHTKLRDLGPDKRRDSQASVDLYALITLIELLYAEYVKSELNRDYSKIRRLARQAFTLGKKYQVFARYQGNLAIRGEMMKFLNGCQRD